ANVGVNGTTGQNYLQIASSTNQGILTLDQNGDLALNDTTPDFGLELDHTTALGYFGITAANGGEGNIFTVGATGNVGVGTSTPYGLLSISANNGTVLPGNNGFDIASSTASATTTLFTVSNTGAVTMAGNLLLSGTGGTASITGPTTGDLSVLSGSGRNLTLGNVGGNSVNI